MFEKSTPKMFYMSLQTNIGKAIRALRAQKGFSQEKLGNYIRSSTKYSQLKIFSKCEHLFRKVELFFFNTEISFSQGKFLLADCEVLAYAHEPWKLRFL